MLRSSSISGAEIQQRNALLSAIRAKEKTTDYKTAFRNVVEEVAYTWFNRLIAVRFMEVNDYLPSRVRVLSSTNPNKLEPDFVTTPFETDLEFSPYEKDVVLQLKDQNKLDELFRMLFIKQCNKLSQILPELFEQISDYTELLLTISFTDKDGVIWQTGELGKVDFGGGGTVAMYVANLDIDTIDVGVPVLSMHAPFEITAKNDVYMAYKAFRTFFKN